MDCNCSILIINWNSWDLLSQCLDALTKQTYKNFKIYVADNASSNEPPDDILTIFPNLLFVKNNENYGFAKANNRLIKLAADSDWIVLLNPDTLPEPEWLEQLFEVASLEPDVVAFGSRQMVYESSNLLDGIGDVYHISGLVWRERHGAQQQPSDLIQQEIFSPCAAAALYRRKAIMDVDGFDEDYFCYVEDVDLGFRLRLSGHKAMYVPNAIVNHIGSATTGGQQSDFSVYHGQRNLVWTYIKNMPGVLFWLLLPCHILLNISAVGWFVMRGQGRIILKAKWDAVKGIPQMWRKRKLIQSNRAASIKDIWRIMDKRLIPWNRRYY